MASTKSVHGDGSMLDLTTAETKITEKVQTIEEKGKNIEKVPETVWNRRFKAAEKELEDRLGNIVTRVVIVLRRMVVIVVILIGLMTLPCAVRNWFSGFIFVISGFKTLFIFRIVIEVLGYRQHFNEFNMEKDELRTKNTPTHSTSNRDTLLDSQASDLSGERVTSVWCYLAPALTYIIVSGLFGIWFSVFFGIYLFDLRCVKDDVWHYRPLPLT